MSASNTTRDGILVKVGQYWQDCDKRMRGRIVKIRAVNNGYAFYKSGNRLLKISIRRMHPHSTGFSFFKNS
jgi:hypothetical protein